jgi:hypothetical protein
MPIYKKILIFCLFLLISFYLSPITAQAATEQIKIQTSLYNATTTPRNVALPITVNLIKSDSTPETVYPIILDWDSTTNTLTEDTSGWFSGLASSYTFSSSGDQAITFNLTIPDSVAEGEYDRILAVSHSPFSTDQMANAPIYIGLPIIIETTALPTPSPTSSSSSSSSSSTSSPTASSSPSPSATAKPFTAPIKKKTHPSPTPVLTPSPSPTGLIPAITNLFKPPSNPTSPVTASAGKHFTVSAAEIQIGLLLLAIILLAGFIFVYSKSRKKQRSVLVPAVVSFGAIILMVLPFTTLHYLFGDSVHKSGSVLGTDITVDAVLREIMEISRDDLDPTTVTITNTTADGWKLWAIDQTGVASTVDSQTDNTTMTQNVSLDITQVLSPLLLLSGDTITVTITNP